MKEFLDVTFTITGVAAGATKFQAKYSDKVFEEAAVIVKEHIDDETDDLDDDGILDIFDDDIDGDGIIDNIPAKLWSPDTGISGGVFMASEVTVAANGTASLEVTQASDSDRWRTADDSGYEEDTVHYDWSATGGSVTPDSNEPWKSTFTVPGQAGEYYVKVKIDDEPAAVTLPDRGNRDDSSVTRTIKIIVTQKKWDVDLAIGKYRQEDGTVKENGRMILPQDQTGETPAPQRVKVFIGQTVDLLAEEATDIDHWKQQPNGEEGYDNDTVTYLWESQSGQIVGDTDKRSAKWQAPEEPGKYTVTCTIDDTPKDIAAGEDGTRDDTSIKRTVEIEVVNGESSATLKLYKDEALTQEVDDAVGGTAYIVLEVKLGEGQHLVSNSATLRVEENYAQHSDTEKRWDNAVSFGSGWQKKDANGEWQSTSETPQSTNSGDEEKYFRKVLLSWPTTSKPLGHNENHSIKLVKVDGGEETELKFAGATGEGETKGPSGISADVKNLVITDVTTNSGNSKYFLYDPEGSNDLANPSIKFTFANEGDTSSSSNRYRWWLWVRSTDETNFATYEGYMDAPGEKNVPIGPNNLPGVGTYAIDIHVEDTKTGDFQGILSKNLSLSSHSFELVNGSSADLEAQISYQIASDRDAQKLTVDLFNPSLDKLKSYDGGTEKNHLYEDLHLYTFIDEDPGGTYIAVFTAKDDFAEIYRDHQSREMLAINWRQSMIPFNVWKDGHSWDHLQSNYTIGWTTIRNAFRSVGLPIRMWAGGVGSAGVPTAGTTTTHLDQGWNVTYNPLSGTQQQILGRTVIVVGFQSESTSGGLDGVQGLFQYFNDWDLPPNKPGLAIINPYGLDSFYGSSLSNTQMQWLMTNVMLHELTHSVIGTHHCGYWTNGNSTPHCVISSPISNYFYANLSLYNVVNFANANRRVPWHSLSEINQMRRQLSLNQY